MPPRLPSPRKPQKSSSGTWIALAGVLGMTLGMIGLCAVVFPSLLAIIALPVALGLVATFHFLVWGRWLSAKLAAEDDVEQGKAESQEPLQ